MRKLLIINKAPYGHLVDSYKWCLYLRTDYDITFVGLGNPVPGTDADGIHVVSVRTRKSRLLTGAVFLASCLYHLFAFRGIAIVVFFEQCGILKRLFPRKRIHLDIRTLSVSKDSRHREHYDQLVRKAVLSYDSVSAISEGVLKRLPVENKRSLVLPLGSDVISTARKQYENIRLLYVGTFDGRDLHKTIEGLSLFAARHPSADIAYHIVGYGFGDEEKKLKRLSASLRLEDKIVFHGRIPHENLSDIMGQCNVGVCFVPVTDYYNIQPPTKTYEYAMSGLFVIATATDENKKLVTPDNGILISDDAESFASALEYVEAHKRRFEERKIRASLHDCTWKAIVDDTLAPFLESLRP